MSRTRGLSYEADVYYLEKTFCYAAVSSDQEIMALKDKISNSNARQLTDQAKEIETNILVMKEKYSESHFYGSKLRAILIIEALYYGKTNHTHKLLALYEEMRNPAQPDFLRAHLKCDWQPYWHAASLLHEKGKDEESRMILVEFIARFSELSAEDTHLNSDDWNAIHELFNVVNSNAPAKKFNSISFYSTLNKGLKLLFPVPNVFSQCYPSR